MKESDSMSMPETASATDTGAADPSTTARKAGTATISSARATWMRLLALATTSELEAAMHAMGDLPPHRWLRKPETGMTMVQGRSGGTGARFNLGEMTITRCALTLSPRYMTFSSSSSATTAPTDAAAPSDADRVGIAYVQGRSAKHAEYAAIADALLQSPGWHEHVTHVVLAPLESARRTRLTQKAAALAQTRVDFFTMDRGENPND